MRIRGSFWRTGSCTMTVSTIRSTCARRRAGRRRPSSASRAAGRPCSCRGRARPPSGRAATTRCRAPRRLRPSPLRACSRSCEIAPRDERLHRRHHRDVAHVVDRVVAHRAREHRQVLGLEHRRTDDRLVLVDVGDDRVDLVVACSRACAAHAAPSG